MVGEQRIRSKEAIEEDVERLQEWLYKQPHLPHDVERELLTAFVYGTKSLEIAKKKLDAYYTKRNDAWELYDFKNRDPTTERFKELCKSIEQFFLPKTTPDGCRVFINVIKKDHLDFFEQSQEIARKLMLLERALLLWPEAPGYYGILDVRDIPANIVAKMKPSTLASFLSSYQDGYPIRLKGIYVTNAAPFIEFMANNLFKPFVKEKLFKRVTISSKDVSAFYDIFPQDILPSDLGDGKEKTTAELNEYWMNQLVEHRSWFEHTSKQMSDESKRPPDESNTYGINGTFRKLAVD